VFEQVYRAEGVVLQYRNPSGVGVEIVLPTPMNARVAQHETDHLNGIMFFNWQDKREDYVTSAHPQPWGARMSKNLSKGVVERWEKEKKKHVDAR
jgi:peptide deformylase